mmetsp:Transcript_18555/g.39851  ORF Transcript_18555/g.39851 Transcript_18555/m.39851 type:complete len:255 (+) Transcript_18555:213-977(+)
MDFGRHEHPEQRQHGEERIYHAGRHQGHVPGQQRRDQRTERRRRRVREVVTQRGRRQADPGRELLHEPGADRSSEQGEQPPDSQLREEGGDGRPLRNDQDADRSERAESQCAGHHHVRASAVIRQQAGQGQRKGDSEQQGHGVYPERVLDRRVDQIVHEDGHPNETDVEARSPQHRSESRRNQRRQIVSPDRFPQWMLGSDRLLNPFLTLSVIFRVVVVLSSIRVVLLAVESEVHRDAGDEDAAQEWDAPSPAH